MTITWEETLKQWLIVNRAACAMTIKETLPNGSLVIVKYFSVNGLPLVTIHHKGGGGVEFTEAFILPDTTNKTGATLVALDRYVSDNDERK